MADATASVYYKELYEDMYGDSHEREVLWDAAKFDQVNPMLTDENGEYGWDVPSGLWQVRVVKDGYLATESEWLPVPPPQLDVNLAMQQPTAPVVQRVTATEQGVDQNGQATLTIKGQGYGTTAVRFTLADDQEIQTLTVVGVKDADGLLTRRPTASRISGTEVLYGSPVSLRCETPGAVIYYTLDGSCPCENPNRLRYENPIRIVSNLTLKAIAVAPGYAESDVATFTYKVKYDPEGIESTTLKDSDKENGMVYDLQGRQIVNSKSANRSLRRGLYIKNRRKFVVR